MTATAYLTALRAFADGHPLTADTENALRRRGWIARASRNDGGQEITAAGRAALAR